ncbi:hypothetical protein MHI18_00700 [Peribacillus sp. FSL H8-0477]|uniref:hypothetical protein n=1 Tax=Peribacillus sp. FSL H8-0477 TaxID=2921388 RepID=UPI0030F8F81F
MGILKLPDGNMRDLDGNTWFVDGIKHVPDVNTASTDGNILKLAKYERNTPTRFEWGGFLVA